MATTTSRSRSLHRTGSSSGASSSQNGGRRSSMGKQGGLRGRFDPNLMMSTNMGDGDQGRDKASDLSSRRKSIDGLKALERAARRNKSSDRLHRGESSATLSAAATKRSKSSTHLASAHEERTGRRRENGKYKGKEFESEDGWTSASANVTPIASLEGSPSTSPMDEGLMLGFKKRAAAQTADDKGANSNTHRRYDMARTTSVQGGETPRVSATQMADEPEPEPLQQQGPKNRSAPASRQAAAGLAERPRPSQNGGTAAAQGDGSARQTLARPAPDTTSNVAQYKAAKEGPDAPTPLPGHGRDATHTSSDLHFSGQSRLSAPQRQDTSRTLCDEHDGGDRGQPLNQASERLQTSDASPSAKDPRLARLRTDVERERSPTGHSDGGRNGSTASLGLDTSDMRGIRCESPNSLQVDLAGAAADAQPPSAHRRLPSNASNRTLRSSVPGLTSSPASLRSRTSVLSSTHLLFPRENQGILPPKLDTHNALAGALGARLEDRGDAVGPLGGPGRASRHARNSLPVSASEPMGLDDMFPDGLLSSRNNSGSSSSHALARRKGSIGSMNGSGITLSSPAPSVGHVASTTASRGANDFNSVRRAPPHASNPSLHEAGGSTESSGFLSPHRRRTTSTQSLTAADAAKLAAKLRLARDSIDEHSAASALRGASASGFLSGPRQGSNPRLEKYNKPVISNFAKDQTAGEGPKAVAVTHASVFSRQFSRPFDSKEEKYAANKRLYRYVTPSGLGGPPIEKSELSDALLGPSLDMDDFESSWAPALANAAGLGSRSMRHPSRNVEPEFGIGPHDAGTAALTGPNSTPLHLIHGLTTTSPDAFPLDPSDVPALQEGGDLFDPAMAASPHGAVKFVDPALIRAIAMTSQAISTHRAHVVTRRYADPMRESLERMVRSSGKWGPIPQTPVTAPASPALSFSGGRWGGRKTATSSPGLRSGGGAFERPGFVRRQTSDASNASHHQRYGHGSGGGGASSHLHNHLAGQLYHLVDAAEHPVRSLKRVWSGGLSRGGLAALTSTREEAS
ncbi:hypothetical protein ACQY0O_001374 [Thecaphora frezii]